ncbi:uncharacterized protein B0H18DRAFT_823024, partial [Fomitopsis serialis]|uniref:uncharacterized protein n=1 Tax=Fomitopsis serialis TaxID=139415 RepID=UPI002008CEEB
LVEQLIRDLNKWEDRGWLDVPNGRPMKALVNILRTRCAATIIKKASTRDEQDMVKKAIEAAQRDRTNEVEPATEALEIDHVFNLSGARLDRMTQKLAYRGILLRKATPERRRTALALSRVTEWMKATQGLLVDKEDVWRSIRTKDVKRNISDFLWKSLHSAQKCGEYWVGIPGYEQRGTCECCDEIDSLSHILTECAAPGQQTVWLLAEALWKKKGLPWPAMTLTTIQSANLMQWTTSNGKRRKNAERLWRILVSESAFLIWKLRCERVIGHESEEDWNHSHRAIVNRWKRTIEDRLHLDMTMSHKRFGRKSLKVDSVLGTWNGVLFDELALPEDW